jgi:hypothetical protein
LLERLHDEAISFTIFNHELGMRLLCFAPLAMMGPEVFLREVLEREEALGRDTKDFFRMIPSSLLILK